MSRREPKSKVEPNHRFFEEQKFQEEKKESPSEASSGWMLPSNRLLEQILSAPDTKEEEATLQEMKAKKTEFLKGLYTGTLVYHSPEEEAKLIEEEPVDHEAILERLKNEITFLLGFISDSYFESDPELFRLLLTQQMQHMGELITPRNTKENTEGCQKFKAGLEDILFSLNRLGNGDLKAPRVCDFVKSIKRDLRDLDHCGSGKQGGTSSINQQVKFILSDDYLEGLKQVFQRWIEGSLEKIGFDINRLTNVSGGMQQHLADMGAVLVMQRLPISLPLLAEKDYFLPTLYRQIGASFSANGLLPDYIHPLFWSLFSREIDPVKAFQEMTYNKLSRIVDEYNEMLSPEKTDIEIIEAWKAFRKKIGPIIHNAEISDFLTVGVETTTALALKPLPKDLIEKPYLDLFRKKYPEEKENPAQLLENELDRYLIKLNPVEDDFTFPAVLSELINKYPDSLAVLYQWLTTHCDDLHTFLEENEGKGIEFLRLLKCLEALFTFRVGNSATGLFLMYYLIILSAAAQSDGIVNLISKHFVYPETRSVLLALVLPNENFLICRVFLIF